MSSTVTATTGTRIATVGIATFGVSFAAALWLVLLCAAHLLRSRALAVAASAMLVAVVAVFAAADRLEAPVTGTGAAAAAAAAAAPVLPASTTSMFDINLGVTTAVLFVGLGLAGLAIAAGELMQPRVAKQVPGGD
jgi:hypothetical protein